VGFTGMHLAPHVGYCMKFSKPFLFLTLLVCLGLTSCTLYHEVGTGGGGGGGGTGTASLTLTLQGTPLTPPASTNILSMIVSINGVSLTPTSGSAQNLTLASPFIVDLNKLQSDSVFLGTLSSIPVGTYTITLSVSAPLIEYCTQLNPGTAGCATGSLAQFSGSVSTPTVSGTVTLSSGQVAGMAIVLNLQDAITVNTTTQAITAVSLTATGALTSSTLPATATTLSSGQLDFVEDLTGVVTSATASTETLELSTATGGTITAVANSSTVYSPLCTAANPSFSGCVAVGQIASVDAAVTTTGVLNILEFDPLATTSADIIEGTISLIPTSSTQFQLVANNLVFAQTGSKISGSLSALMGAPVNITLSSPSPFVVDTKGLTTPVSNFVGATDTSVLFPGQTVAVVITAFTAASGTTPAAATANAVMLRFTRTSGLSSAAGGLTFDIGSLPPFFGENGLDEVQLTEGTPPTSISTNFDGANPTSSPLASGENVAIRALYFAPTNITPFSAAKVRVIQ
jgi:hypothetical protein